MVLQCGEPVNIVSADLKRIGDKVFGQMLLKLPEDPAAAGRMLAYLDRQNVSYCEEV